MARFKKGSRAAKAWGRRMQALRYRGKRKNPETRKRKPLRHRIRKHIRHIRHAIRHPVRAYKLYRARHRSHEKRIKHKMPFAEVGVITALAGSIYGNFKSPTGSTQTSGGGSGTTTSSPLSFASNLNTVTTGQLLTLLGAGFTANGSVTITLTTNGVLQNTFNVTADSSGPNNTGGFTLNNVSPIFSGASLINVFKVTDNATGRTASINVNATQSNTTTPPPSVNPKITEVLIPVNITIGNLQVFGSGFTPNGEVIVTINLLNGANNGNVQLGTTTADSNGNVVWIQIAGGTSPTSIIQEYNSQTHTGLDNSQTHTGTWTYTDVNSGLSASAGVTV